MRLGKRALVTTSVIVGTVALGAVGALLPASAGVASDTANASVDEGDVNDFDYSSWDARYEIGLDEDGRAIAHVTETLVAKFPETDQNRGIVRGYPERYEGAGLSLDIRSVTDESGQPVPFEVDAGENGVSYVLTGNDDYVHGSTTYVIEYTMRDVIIPASGSGLDEFYWDLLPLDSTQDIGSFHAEVVFSPKLAAAYAGESACYQGQSGENTPCTLTQTQTDDGGLTFTTESGARAARDGVTVAIGFDADTVTQPPGRIADPVADFGAAIAAGGALVLAAASWVAWALFVQRRRRAGGTVIAQYDVPDDLSPLLAAALLPSPKDVVPAEIAHLAVRGALHIEDTDSGDKTTPVLHLRDRSAAPSDLDRRTLAVLFPDDDTTRQLSGEQEALATQLTALTKGGTKEAAARGWTEKARSPLAGALCWASVAVLLVALGFLIWTAIRDRDSSLVLSIVMVALAFGGVVFTAIVAFSRPVVLTAAGAERYAYLMGVREFIQVAEADRIRMLQSASGAERRADGEIDVVVLYERLLPYAMLFGEEKTWARVLEATYSDAHAQPNWISSGHGIAFAVMMSSFSHTTQAAATYVSPSSGGSSSFGGSMGGGFSGGGGGGGFSGGR